jgi:hypothetical protein
VLEARPASNLVTELTGITHHSPQVILFKDGKAVFEVDNWDIIPEVLAEGFTHLPASGDVVVTESTSKSNLTPYLQVLKQYLAGLIDGRQFEYSYTTMFRDDASLRSREEVEVLSSIFGDVDKHREMHLMLGGHSHHEIVRERAETAYERLKRL